MTFPIWSRALIFGALAIALAACQAIAVNPAPDPATLGFEALPPPTEEASIASAAVPNAEASDSPFTLIHFSSGEDCMWIGGEPTLLEDVPVAYHCDSWLEDSGSTVALGPLATVQGLSFQAQRLVAAPVDGSLQVVSTTPLPFSLLQVVLDDGTVCTNVGNGTSKVIDDWRVSFTCDAPAFGDSSAETDTTLVLLNGLYPGDDGIFTVEGGVLSGENDSETLSAIERLSVANIVAQPLIVSVTAEENGKTVYLAPAQLLEVTLDSNITTGYSWTVAEESTAPLSLAGEPEYISPEDPAPGAGGSEVLRFDVAGIGSGELLLNYARPFESDEEPVETYRTNVIVALTPAENDSRVELSLGETMAVELPGNPSTGYQWQVVENDGQILAQTSDPVTMTSVGAPGAVGVQRFTFEGVAQGTMMLNLIYTRPSETESEPSNTFSVEVTVE